MNITDNFALSRLYSAIRQPGFGIVGEKRAPPYELPFSERHLQCIWSDPELRPAVLRTAAGEEVLVVNPGQWNMEAGPDFVNAVLTIGPGRRQVSGDVEIHIHPSQWQAHAHAGNPLFSHLAAHVCWFPGSLPKGALPPGALEISLKDAILADPCFSFESVDTAAYPYVERRIPSPCARILSAQPPARFVELVESAGCERLRRKSGRIGAQIGEEGSEQTLYEETLAALGYRNNRTQFRALARRVQLARLTAQCGADTSAALAVLLGVSGLLPQKVSGAWSRETRNYVRRLWDLWWKRAAEWEPLTMKKGEWSLAGLRPQNHPARRMAAAASLFCGRPAILERLRSIPTDTPERWISEALRLFTSVESDPFWARSLTFSSSRQGTAAGLIGPERAAAILANAVLPFMCASEGPAFPAAAVMKLLPPEHDSGAARKAAYALLGRDHNPAIYRTALRQQGLLQIFNDFCLTDRSGCEDCPLPAALESWLDASPI